MSGMVFPAIIEDDATWMAWRAVESEAWRKWSEAKSAGAPQAEQDVLWTAWRAVSRGTDTAVSS